MDVTAFDAHRDAPVAADLAALACRPIVTVFHLTSEQPVGSDRAIAAAADRVFGNAVCGGEAADGEIARAAGGEDREAGRLVGAIIGGERGEIGIEEFDFGGVGEFGDDPARADIEDLGGPTSLPPIAATSVSASGAGVAA